MKKRKILNSKIFFTVLLTLCITLFYACEKTVVFNVDVLENKLVVNSFISTMDHAYADVSVSLDPLSSDYPEILDDATIRLFKNGVFITDYSFDPFYYRYVADSALLSASAGDVFSIIATAPGRDTVTAQTTVPSKVEIESIQITDTVLMPSYGISYDSLGNPIFGDSIPYYKIEIVFTDPAGDDSYSLITAYEDIYGGIVTCFTSNDPVYTLGNSFELQSEDNYRTFCDQNYFTDISFAGKHKTLTVYLIQISGIFFPEAKYTVTLQHLSPEYYKYITTTNLQQGVEGNPFAQPVSVFSNIENGFGIFAAYNESLAEIEL